MESPSINLSLLAHSVFVTIIFCSSLSLFYLSYHVGAVVIPRGNETDRLSLLAIKASITDDPFDVLSSWNESIHFCYWLGVTCDNKNQRVTMLDLTSYQLVGSIPPHLGNMSSLQVLSLQNNSLNNEIPVEIGRLIRLQRLQLDNNSFEGKIPVNLSQCSSLVFLGLSGNMLVGEVPADIGTLQKLEELVLDANNFTGTIPPSFGNLSNLVKLSVAKNNIEGSIPHTLSNLNGLVYLALGENKLSGILPLSIFNISCLKFFHIRQNQIQGNFPSDFKLVLPNLQVFNLYNNRFSGNIPASIVNSSNLFFISFARNNFTGKVPNFAGLVNLRRLYINHNHLGEEEDSDLDFLPSLSNASSLEVLCWRSNNLNGELSSAVNNFSTNLKLLVIGRNNIRGRIPSGIGNLFNLQELDMEFNQFSGEIPVAIGHLHKLKVFLLNGNRLTGSIPLSLGNLTWLSQLGLRSNNLEGKIPSSLGKCQNLVEMHLSQNNLGGSIPREVIGLSSLSITLDLSQNYLTGPIPLEVGKLRNLEILDVSSNNLSGEIPKSLGSCISMESLLMGGNLLEGNIPSTLELLKGLEYLDLSHNNLSGQIPKFLELLNLSYLNLSYNNFEGEVPTQGIFKNSSAILIIENRGLCGGVPHLKLPKCSSDESKKMRLTATMKLIIIIVSVIFGLILITLSSLVFIKSRKRRKLSLPCNSAETLFCNVSYEDLLSATDGFCSANLIGYGSFGSVYKGILFVGEEETVVAVKVLHLQQEGASESFRAECEAMTNIRHRNIVKIITACSSVDYHGNDFKALVYEFMANGNLDEWIHPVPKEDKAQERRYLNLIQRLNIAIDIASALDYLHHQCHLPLAHCDLKPNNILLDSTMTAHVGDFGSARFLLRSPQHCMPNQTISLAVKGTIGFVAPEYGMGNEATTIGDVYSYGILLLEMFTGKKPTDGFFKDGLDLHNYTLLALTHQPWEIVDPTLMQEEEEKEANTKDTCINHIIDQKTQDCLISVFKIGLACSRELPENRIGISNVVIQLQSIKSILLGKRT